MRELLLVIPFDVGRLEPGLLQLPVEEDARPGPALAVDEADTGEIVDALNIHRVAVWNDDALMPDGEVDDRYVHIGQEFLDEREVEVVGSGIEKMHPGEVAGAVFQGRNAAHAADVRGGEPEGLGQAHEFVGKQIKGVVVAAHTDKDAVEFRFRNGQFGGHHGVLVQAFGLLGDAHVALRAGDGGDVPGPASERRGDQFVADPPDGHAHMLLDARTGWHGTGQLDGDNGFCGRLAVRKP